jgi:hypothetical protein
MHKIVLVLAIAAVGEALIALHLVRQLHAERENTQTLQARVTELEGGAPQGAAGATFVAVPTQPAVSPFTVGGQTAPAPSQSQPPPAIANVPDQQQLRERMNAEMEHQRALLRDPEYRDAMRTQQKLSMLQAHPGLERDLNLTADQVDRLFGTIAEQTLRSMDTGNRWEPQADPAKAQEIQRKALEQQSVNEAELKSVLGEAKYREWLDYQTSAPARYESARLRSLLANAGVPLEQSLAKPLLKVLQDQQKLEQQRVEQYIATQGAAASASVGFIAVADGTNAVQAMTNTDESLAKSQRQQREALARVLTPEQLKVVEDEQNTQLQMQRLQMRIMRAQQAVDGPDPAQNATGFFVPSGTVVPVND